MKKLVNSLLFTLLLTLLFNVVEQNLIKAEDKKQINVATNAEFGPFEYKDGNDIVGIDIDIAKYIVDKMGADINIIDISFDALILELKNHTCDFAIAAMSKNDEKENSVDFSDPYFIAKQDVILPIDSEIKSPGELNGKRIGVHLGTTGDSYCTNNFKDSEIHRYKNGAEAVMDLVNGRLDAVVIDDLPARMLIEKNNRSVKKMDGHLFKEEYRIVVPKGEIELLYRINTILTEMKSTGKIDEIVEKYTKESSKSNNSLINQIYNNLIYKERYMGIVQGLITTLKITVVALIIGLILGVATALIKVSKDNNLLMKFLNIIANTYLSVIKGTPMVVQLFVIYYLILGSSGLDKILVAMISFGINSGAYVSDIIRAGILSVDVGQTEAGRSLGLNSRQTMMKIVFPQALKNSMPTLCNEFINLLKETSVAGFIGIMDLSKAGEVIRSQTYEPLVPLLSVAIIYFSITQSVVWLMSLLERRLRKSDMR